MSQTIKIPVVIGKNRLRGKICGAMVDDQGTEFALLKSTLRTAAQGHAEITDLDAWVRSSVVTMLGMYEAGHREWQSAKDKTIGCVQEFVLPGGQSLVMADRRVLDRLPA